MGLARFFETMKKKDAFSGKIPAYLSTHPNLDERIARVKILADQSGTTPARLLQDYHWRDISNICGKTAPKPNP
jgi:predicted Zn-dependent protease